MSAMSTARSEAASILQFLGYSIKPELLEVISGILQRDVFAILPTEFWKISLCFHQSGVCIYRLFPSEAPSIVIVVTPLTAIMKDQIRKSSPK